jgi:dTDP-4-dehydrorhamnose 3,5-epimerase
MGSILRGSPRRRSTDVKVTTTPIDGVLVLEPRVFRDERGLFLESFSQRSFDALVGRPVAFVQDNHSRSTRGVLRGLHYQRPPHAQAKLVRVVQGRVFDVVVDVRPGSATFGKWVGVEIGSEDHRQVWVPEGMAHGFLVLSESADVLYRTTDYYAPASEGSVRWDDPAIGIEWPLAGRPIVSAKDAAAPSLADALPFG